MTHDDGVKSYGEMNRPGDLDGEPGISGPFSRPEAHLPRVNAQQADLVKLQERVEELEDRLKQLERDVRHILSNAHGL